MSLLVAIEAGRQKRHIIFEQVLLGGGTPFGFYGPGFGGFGNGFINPYYGFGFPYFGAGFGSPFIGPFGGGFFR